MTESTNRTNDERPGEMSTFALDVYWAQGRGAGATDDATSTHVASCARCQDYLAHLDALHALDAFNALDAGSAVDAGSAMETAAPRVSLLRAPSRPSRWGMAAMVGLAAAAGVAIAVRSFDVQSDHYLGVKGTPAVQVLLHRGQDTRVWDGRAALHPGDALALRVACEGLKHVVVAIPGPAGWARLSDTTCPPRDEPLPFTLRVDDEPGDEKLAVVLTSSAIDDDALQRVVDEDRRASDVWVVRYVMAKETETDR